MKGARILFSMFALAGVAGAAGCDAVHGKRNDAPPAAPAQRPQPSPSPSPSARGTATGQAAAPLNIAPEHAGLFPDEMNATVAALAQRR